MADPGRYVPGTTRLRDVELVVPVRFGSVAHYLGKKATDIATHKWTVYLRGASNEDLSHIVQSVTFNLHASFQNPTRVCRRPPYEVNEHGWGEFELTILLTFTPDSEQGEVELVHKLKLYDDDDPDMKGKARPVVSEQYDEIIISDPPEAFYNRVISTPPRMAAMVSCAQLLPPSAELEELQQLKAARAHVAQIMASIQQQEQQLDLEGVPGSGAGTPRGYH